MEQDHTDYGRALQIQRYQARAKGRRRTKRAPVTARGFHSWEIATMEVVLVFAHHDLLAVDAHLQLCQGYAVLCDGDKALHCEVFVHLLRARSADRSNRISSFGITLTRRSISFSDRQNTLHIAVGG